MDGWGKVLGDICVEQNISREFDNLKIFADTDAKIDESGEMWVMNVTAVHRDGRVIKDRIETRDYFSLSDFKEGFIKKQLAQG